MFRANQRNARKIKPFLHRNGANARLWPRQYGHNQPLLRGQKRATQAFRIAGMRNGGGHRRQGAAAREKRGHHLASMGPEPGHLRQGAFFGG